MVSILINENSKVIVQGITGRAASMHSRLMKSYGTNVVAGVSPMKGGTICEGVPVYNTVLEAQEKTEADVSILFLPPLAAKEGIYEAIDAGLNIIVSPTEGIPILDQLDIIAKLRQSKALLIGPSSPGIITPGEAKVGFLPERACTKGPVGLASRSGTLSYEVAYQLTRAGVGQSTWVGVGGEMLSGTAFKDLLPLYEKDEETKAIVIIGEIGGNSEEDLAAYVQEFGCSKPIFAYIAGKTAPPDTSMGHAGAIVTGGSGLYSSKVSTLKHSGIDVVEKISDLPRLVKSLL